MSVHSTALETDQNASHRLPGFYRDNERVILMLLVLGVATVPYFLIERLTDGRPTATLTTWADHLIPFQKHWEFVYMSFQLMCFLPFTVISDFALLRRMAAAYATTYGVAYVSFIIFPVQMTRYAPIEHVSFADWWVQVNMAIDAPFNCFPSLHVGIALIAAFSVWKANRAVGVLAGLQALAIAISTLTLKQHYIADVLAAFILASAVAYKFLVPYRRTPRSALPRRYALIIPSLYALLMTLTFWAYSAGVPAPPSQWERLTVRVQTTP